MSSPKKKEKSPEYEGKREKLLGKKKTRISTWKIILIALVVAALPVSWLFFRAEPDAGATKGSGTQVMEKVSYQKQTIAMVNIEAAATKGSVIVPLDSVKKNKLVYFEFQQKGSRMPLLAYISPSGKLITAVSVCEPCNSTKFHIEGDQMVCNACFTRWDLETLKGISGGCLGYPPDVIPHTVREGNILIQEMDLQNWKPRVGIGRG